MSSARLLPARMVSKNEVCTTTICIPFINLLTLRMSRHNQCKSGINAVHKSVPVKLAWIISAVRMHNIETDRIEVYQVFYHTVTDMDEISPSLETAKHLIDA